MPQPHSWPWPFFSALIFICQCHFPFLSHFSSLHSSALPYARYDLNTLLQSYQSPLITDNNNTNYPFKNQHRGKVIEGEEGVAIESLDEGHWHLDVIIVVVGVLVMVGIVNGIDLAEEVLESHHLVVVIVIFIVLIVVILRHAQIHEAPIRTIEDAYVTHVKEEDHYITWSQENHARAEQERVQERVIGIWMGRGVRDKEEGKENWRRGVGSKKMFFYSFQRRVLKNRRGTLSFSNDFYKIVVEHLVSQMIFIKLSWNTWILRRFL